jgi:hypothetical protein
MSHLSVVDLLSWARDHPDAQGAVLEALGIDQEFSPGDVPLHEFDFRTATLTVHKDVDDDSTEESVVELFAAKAPHAAVGRDGEGELFLIRAGDWVLRSKETGDYGVLRVVESG